MSCEQCPADYRSSHLADNKGDEYDRGATWGPFDAYMADHEARILDAILPRLFPAGVPRYLDFACGTGRITQIVEARAQQSFGVDVSPSMLDKARAKCPRTTFLQCDLTADQSALEPVQLITSFRFFGHAQDDLRLAALRAMRRLLTSDGYLIFNDHCNPRSLHSLLLRLRGAPLLPTAGGGPINLHHARVRSLLHATGFRLVASHGIGLWVVRSSFMRKEVLESRLAKMLEPLSRLPFLARICPDAVLVARPV